MLRSMGLAALLCLVIGSAGTAQATSTGQSKTFAELVAGATLVSGNGQLLFSGFQVTTVDNVSADLSQYTVSVLHDGIRITGPLSAGQSGAQFSFEYMVSGIETLIEDAHLELFAAGTGGGAADVVETLFGPDHQVEIGNLGAWVMTFPGTDSDEIWFEPVTKLWVEKDIIIEGTAEGTVAIEYVDQRFSTVPEPVSLGLLGLGLAGLWRQGRRPRH